MSTTLDFVSEMKNLASAVQSTSIFSHIVLISQETRSILNEKKNPCEGYYDWLWFFNILLF